MKGGAMYTPGHTVERGEGREARTGRVRAPGSTGMVVVTAAVLVTLYGALALAVQWT